jgi:hypothetical protein
MKVRDKKRKWPSRWPTFFKAILILYESWIKAKLRFSTAFQSAAEASIKVGVK